MLVYRHAVSLIIVLQHSLLHSDHYNETLTQAVASVTIMVAMLLTACWQSSFYQLAACEAHGWLVLRLLSTSVYLSLYYVLIVCPHTYHMHNNYVTYIVTMQPLVDS